MKRLYGQATSSHGGRYRYRRRGLLDDVPHRRLIRGVLILRAEDADRVAGWLRGLGAEVHVRRVDSGGGLPMGNCFLVAGPIRWRGGILLRIVFADNGLVDFGEPIWMSDGQREGLVRFMEGLLDHTPDVVPVREKERRGPGLTEGKKDWTIDEYCELLSPSSNATVAKRLGRSGMGVRMKRGDFVPSFLAWLKRKGYTLPATKELVTQFFEERAGK